MWIFFFSILFSLSSAFSSTNLDNKIVDEYLKIQKKFSVELCSPDTSDRFEKLFKNYKGDGNFIPIGIDDALDSKAIKSHIALFNDKKNWIKNNISFLEKFEDFKNEKLEINQLEKGLERVLGVNQKYFFENNKIKKEELKKELKENFEQLKLQVEKIKEVVPFLLSFKFPIDHLELRKEYEKNKLVFNKEARARSNAIYIYRKIVQDGLYEEDYSRNDLFLRATFDTLYLSLKNSSGRIMLTDNERVDLLHVINAFKKILDQRPEKIIARFKEWQERNHRSHEFYQSLIDNKKIKTKDSIEFKNISSLLEEKARALYILKEYVLSKEARTYEYWSRQSDLNQALFAIETILYNEVGSIDYPDALERKDVAKIVINRSANFKFNQLSEHDSIKGYISKHVKTKSNKWLNVLFKEGEFSFTYFYIPANLFIYCPEMSKTAQYLRRENLRIALKLLNSSTDFNFKALRYYSRISMHGRIEMDDLWNNFKLVPERPGNRIKNQRKIYEFIKKNNFRFLYKFSNEDLNKSYLVVEIKGRNYVIDADDEREIFYYRSPHQFKYFSPIK